MRSLSLALPLLACLAGPSPAQEALDVAPHHRLANRTDHGVCWWACAQMVGNRAGIVPLQGIVDRVVRTGVGFKEGATGESIARHLKALGVRALTNPAGAKGQAAVDRVQSWLDRGLPVIVSYSAARGGTHAVLLVRLGREKESWRSGTRDYAVEYIDPNRPRGTTRRPWSWFVRAWTGRAVAFDPAGQDPSLIRPPDLRPGRLMLADCMWHRQTPRGDAAVPGDGGPGPHLPPPRLPPRKKKVPGPASGLKGPGLPPGLPPRLPARLPTPRKRVGPGPHLPPVLSGPVPAVETPAHRQPYTAGHPVNHVPPPRVPSNQDIRDGVTRPSDVFLGLYGYGPGYDYHSQYRR